MKKQFLALAVLVALISACGEKHDELPESSVPQNDNSPTLVGIGDFENTTGEQFGGSSNPTPSSSLTNVPNFSSFNCTALAARRYLNSDLIEFSIRGCFDVNTNELVNCAGPSIEPNLIISRTVLKKENGVRKRKTEKTYSIPGEDVRLFRINVDAGCQDCVKIKLRKKLDLAEDNRTRNVKLSSYPKRLYIKAGSVEFANFTNSSTRKLMLINFGRYMSVAARTSIQCQFF